MENNNSFWNDIKSRFFSAIQSFAGLSVSWLALILLFSVIEIAFNSFTHSLPSGFFSVLIWSWLMDLVFWLKWLFPLAILYLLIYGFSVSGARVLFQLLIIVFFVFHVGLLLYYNTSMVLLGADIYSYSLNDIQQIVGASGGINLLSLIIFIVFICLIGLSLRLLRNRIKINQYLAAGVIVFAGLFTFFGVNKIITPPALHSDFENNLALNKSDHFYSTSYSHFFPSDFETDIYADDYIEDFTDKQIRSMQFEYTDEADYPFLHKDAAEDVLSPFFNPQTIAPNIVIVIIEGLGRAYSNDGAYMRSFTPFLDSLSTKSMYWNNFLSQGGRTFAILPSLLGSLPFAKNGFLDLGKNMPEQLSLLNLLKFNGYHTSFYYGGDAGFDNMDLYLKANDIDELRDEKTFPGSYIKLPMANGFTWGYNDKEIFRYYFATRPDLQGNQPQLSVILTLASHNPFIINEPDKYLNMFEKRMNTLRLSESEKSNYRDYQNQYASVLYADDALRYFFRMYEKRSDYANTIFLITGDHRMPEIPMKTKIDRYHVPFIIYSPLLKRTAEISSVSTHFDIPPTLLAYLKNNHQIKLPSLNSWLGKGLDTSRNFRNLHTVPFIQTKTDMIDFVMGEYHLNGDNLYKLSHDLDEIIVNDNEKKRQLINAFNQFKKRNTVISIGGKIIPDSLFRNYTVPR